MGSHPSSHYHIYGSVSKGAPVGQRYSSISCLTSVLDGGECSSSRSGRFTRQRKRPIIHWTRLWVGPKADMEVSEKKHVYWSQILENFS